MKRWKGKCMQTNIIYKARNEKKVNFAKLETSM